MRGWRRRWGTPTRGVRDLFTDLARAAGASDPAGLAQQLVLLYDGASVSASMDHNRTAAATARLVAEALVATAPVAKALPR